MSVAALIERIGGWEGTITDPWGNQHGISLEALRGSDPEATFVILGFRAFPLDRAVADDEAIRRMRDSPVDWIDLHVVDESDPVWAAAKEEPTLGEMRRRLGGEEGLLDDGTGKLHRVSLRAWRGLDPDRTRVVIKHMHGPAGVDTDRGSD